MGIFGFFKRKKDVEKDINLEEALDKRNKRRR